MTIIYRNEWNIKERINFPLDLSKLDATDMEYDPMGMFIAINDKALQDVICRLADDMASWADWCFADNDQTKMNLYIPMPLSSAEFDPSFQIEIQPPKWTQEEQAAILSRASKDMFGDDFSEYSNWQDIFASSDDFHNGIDTMCETLKVYDAEFTVDELKEISWILISYLEHELYKLQTEKRTAVTC